MFNKIYIFLIILFLVGCAPAKINSRLRISFQLKDFNREEATRVTDAVYKSVEKLEECAFFKRNYAFEHDLFRHLMKENDYSTKVTIARADPKRVKRINEYWTEKSGVDCEAMAFADSEDLYIGIERGHLENTYIDPFNINFTRTIGHELLHLATLSHRVPQRPYDDIPRILDKCDFEEYEPYK